MQTYTLAEGIEAGCVRVHSSEVAGRIFGMEISPALRMMSDENSWNAIYLDNIMSIGAAVVHGGTLISRSTLRDGAEIMSGCSVRSSYVGRGALVGCSMELDRVYIDDGAVVCRKLPGDRAADSDYKRRIQPEVAIGTGVSLHAEVQLGSGAVIPVQQSIELLGRFGTRQRMVTVYGSGHGALYSVGCQFGITFKQFMERVYSGVQTTEASADQYKPHQRGFLRAGRRVQEAFNDSGSIVNDLIGKHQEWLNNLTKERGSSKPE